MDTALISKLLDPFVSAPLVDTQSRSISMYIDILLRWNQTLNLTAIRDPEYVVTRHFGESIFAAQHLYAASPALSLPPAGVRLLDVGSGAGFPGLPIKICVPELAVTLIESKHKKATFLREVIRALTLTDIDVFTGRAQDFPACSADMVTLRAVERFDTALLAAVRLLRTPGRLALLIGRSQVSRAASLLPRIVWRDPLSIPLSAARVILLGDSVERIPAGKNLT